MSKKAQKAKGKTAKPDAFDFVTLLNAIKSIKINKVSVSSAAAANGIPERSLNRYSKKFDEKVADITAYSDEHLLQILQSIASYKAVADSHTVHFSWLNVCGYVFVR